MRCRTRPNTAKHLLRSLDERAGQVSEIAATLDLIAEYAADSDEIKAYAEWMRAIESLVKGELQKCVEKLDTSEKSFALLGKNHSAATTQISKFYALALLGRYDEAVECGLRAREVFLSQEDIYSVGKIEHNIGNLYWRRDFYREAEPFLASARERFSQINDARQPAMVENCQAFVKALQNDFRGAETIYETALTRAKAHSLLVAEADRYNPAVKIEIKVLSQLFPKAVKLIDKKATLANISKNCAASDVVHLACHGKFRADQPMFSAIRLYKENLTVGDIRRLDLHDKLVVLSACETGLNRIESGEELFGLTRGFLAAGASCLVVSLWTVDDDSTLSAMCEVYKNLQTGENPAKALRRAQIKLLEEKSHSYFWSPFIVCGQF